MKYDLRNNHNLTIKSKVKLNISTIYKIINHAIIENNLSK